MAIEIFSTVSSQDPNCLGFTQRSRLPFLKNLAEVVELVDALASGASGRKPVGVRVPPSALSSAARRHRPRATTHRFLPPGYAHSQIPLLSESRGPSVSAAHDGTG